MAHPTDHVVQQVIQQWLPSLPPIHQRQLARWTLGAVLAGSANGPSIIQALATAGVARPATLDDQWDTWLDQPAQQTTDPPAAGERPVVSPLAAGADLLRVILAWWTDDRLILGLDASYRRDDVVLLRASVLYRGTALPVAWVLVPANTPGAWAPHWERMLAWIATVLDDQRQVLVVTDQGLWSPRLWHAIQDHGWHPVMRVQDRATFAPTGEHRQPVRDLAGGPGRGWIGAGTAFKHAEKRLDGTLATAWDPQAADPWALLTDLPPSQMDAAWYALRMWDEEGFRASKSMGWNWQRGQLTDVDAVAWQYLVVAVATLWTLAMGTRIEDAQQQGVAPGQLRRPPAAPPQPRHPRRSGTARRVISLIQQGTQMLRWLLARGRTWLRLWLRPEPWPKTPDSWSIHIHSPS